MKTLQNTSEGFFYIQIAMQKTVTGILCAFLVFAPFLFIQDLNVYDNKRVIQLFILGIIGLLFLSKLFFKKRYIQVQNSAIKPGYSGKIVIVLLTLFCFGAFSVIRADRIEYALLDFSFFFLLLSLVFSLSASNQKTHLFIGKAIIASALIYSIFYLMLFFGNYVSSYFNPMIILWPGKYNFSITIDGIEFQGKETLFFTHRRFFNHTQTWTLPLLVGFLCFYRNKYPDRKTIIYLLTALVSFWWMLIFASGGRGSTLSIILSLVILAVLWRKDLLPFLRQGVISLSAGVLSYFVFFKLIPASNVADPLLRSSDSGRFGMWETALNMWIQNPFFGVGPMHYSQIKSIPSFAHPHNFYIQFLSEWGLLAFITLAVLLFLLVKFILKNYPDENQKFQTKFLYIAATWALLAAFIHAFFSGVFHTPMSQIWFVLICAWLLGFKRKENSVSNRFNINKYSSVAFLVLLLSVSLLLNDDVLNIYQGYESYLNRFPESKFYPRFWGQGLFD